MIGIYFSGTGNTGYCVEAFLKECDIDVRSFSIEEGRTLYNVEIQQLRLPR